MVAEEIEASENNRSVVYYEMSDENLRRMLESLEPFDRQSLLIDAREKFGVEGKIMVRIKSAVKTLLRLVSIPVNF